MGKWGFFVVWAALASQGALIAQRWERLDRCEFYEGSHSDGDSIEVRRSGKHHIFRLYFVDCLEKNPASRARRATQAQYFGMNRASDAPMRAAYLAKSFTRDRLREPFTIYTCWQPVDLSRGNPSIRAFVKTADGKDLSMLLVREGLAIIRHGRKAVCDHPDGQTRSEFASQLREAEEDAKKKGRGAWGLAKGDEGVLPLKVLEATQREDLVSNAGRRVQVRGRVSRVGALGDGRLTFINFSAKAGSEGFVGIVRKNFFPRFLERFPEGLAGALTGRHVLLEGVITLFRNNPQIELESPKQIRIEP
jgi:endonuclease YncB( thermonuclease family)